VRHGWHPRKCLLLGFVCALRQPPGLINITTLSLSCPGHWSGRSCRGDPDAARLGCGHARASTAVSARPGRLGSCARPGQHALQRVDHHKLSAGLFDPLKRHRLRAFRAVHGRPALRSWCHPPKVRSGCISHVSRYCQFAERQPPLQQGPRKGERHGTPQDAIEQRSRRRDHRVQPPR